jgi:hypothetical protein
MARGEEKVRQITIQNKKNTEDGFCAGCCDKMIIATGKSLQAS